MTQITIPNVPTEVEYSVTTSQTGPFTVPFPFFEDGDVKCLVTDAIGVETTLEVITGFTWTTQDVPIGQEGSGYTGGSITLNVAIGADGSTTLKIYRDTVVDRTANFPNTGPFSMPLLNDEQNKHIAIMQEYSAENDALDVKIDANTAQIAQNVIDILTNAAGISANTSLISSIVMNPALSTMSLYDVRRYGMDVANSGADNHTALIAAMAANVPLDFQEIYPISTDGLSPIVLGTGLDLHWFSSNGEGGLDFQIRATPDTNYVKREGLIEIVNAGDIVCEGLRFINPDGDVNTIFSSLPYDGPDAEDFNVDSFTFRNNHLSGRIAGCYFRGDEDVFPSVTWFGIREVLIEDNFVEDAYALTFNLRHVPHERIIFRGNRFRNIDHMVIQAGISNGAANGTDIFDFKKIFIAENNSIHADLSFWSTNTAGSYLGLCLFEGYEAVVKNNHMEGVKTAQTNMLVYLSYMSCMHVTECDNVYINNAHTDRATARNTLMKSKGVGIGSSTETGSRVYLNNKYTVTEEWATAIGEVATDIVHRIYEFPSGTVSTNDRVEGNTFDLLTLEGSDAATAAHLAHSASWINNHIRAKIWDHVLLGSDNNAIIYFSKNTLEPTVSYVCGNSFTVETTLITTTHWFIDCAAVAGTVVVKDNHVQMDVPNVFGQELKLLRGPPYYDKLVMEGNSTKGNNTMLFGQTRGNILQANINERIHATDIGGVQTTLWLPTMGRGSHCFMRMFGDKAIRQYFPWSFTVAEIPNFPDPPFPDLVGNPYIVKTRVRRSDSTGWQEISYEYSFYWDGISNWRVSFTDIFDNAVDELIDSGVGVNTDVKLLSNIGTSSALLTNVALRNISNEEYFRIEPDFAGTEGFMEIEVEIV